MSEETNTHNIRVTTSGAFCSCGRSRETPNRSDSRNWANEHFKYNQKGMLTDESLNP